jgi:hypothetical protein
LSLVDKLKTQGYNVYLLKAPISDSLFEIEKKFSVINDKIWDFFENKLIKVEGEFLTYDGSHLSGNSAMKYSEKVAERILLTGTR